MVMNVSAARSGQWEIIEEDITAVVVAVREWEKVMLQGPVLVKLILETPYLDDEQKREACKRAATGGMDYVKTATGFGPGGATVDDIRLMREAVGDELGVKAAGGIRTWEDAKAMFEAGADRIGTSAGPELLEDFIRAIT
jgi:deoxyribose-phosphate aldolase